MHLQLRLLKFFYKHLHFILIGVVVFVLTAMVSLYFINLYEIKSNNIRSRIFGLDIYRIPSQSMQPLLGPGDIIIVSNKAYLDTSIKRSEVVVFNRTLKNDPSKIIPFIKRVVGISGDRLRIEKGLVFINGSPFPELYIKSTNRVKSYSLKMSVITIPKDKLFVLGDNRDNSNDSRMFGVISTSDVVGKATNILYSAEGKSGNKIK